MTCIICHHQQLENGTTTVTLERGDTTLVFKHVPAQVCANCGETYLDETTTEALLKAAEVAVKNGVQIEVRNFFAA